jgi:DNA invertase Pin-like site-specific DNA recombinase
MVGISQGIDFAEGENHVTGCQKEYTLGDNDGEVTMIACYCRVSSRHQKSDGQKAEMLQWLRGNNIPLSRVQWFEDIETGDTLHRPAFAAMQRAIFAGVVVTVVVWKLDRLSRRQCEGVNLLADWCERGVRVVVVTQQIDLRGTVGRLVASVLFGLAEIEQEYRRERQAAGIAVAKQKGVYRGRLQGTTKAHPRRAQVLRARGCCVPEITTALRVSPRTVFRYLAAMSG